jgi:pimeloyl-ACP methyl ester carboxylesterase
MDNFRYYGLAPFRVAVVHGGPGAAGEMAPVARALSAGRGVLEPLQTAANLDGQVQELHDVLEDRCDLPVTLVGHSWGAWLSCLVAARRPGLVRRLVLVSAGPFEESYVPLLEATRFSRLTTDERREMTRIAQTLGDPDSPGRDEALGRLGSLASKCDAFAPIITARDDPAGPQPDAALFTNVWEAAAALRRSGGLMEEVRRITVPVTAIHGDYDPHPADGVQTPLGEALADFQFVVIEKCGHTPWNEQHGRAPFYRELERVLTLDPD